jgi:adenine phosphoribosyltransferase
MSERLRHRLKDAFRWNEAGGADPTGWWLDPDLRGELADALAALHEGPVTHVVGVATRGFILGVLVAERLGAGFVEVRKDRRGDAHGKTLLRRSTPPDYAARDLTLTLRRGLLSNRDRVLMIDDWIETGAQATAVGRLVDDAGASWVGVAAVVDATTAAVRRDLAVRSLLSVREL